MSFLQGGALQAGASQRAPLPLPGVRRQVHDEERQVEPQLHPQGRRPHQVRALLKNLQRKSYCQPLPS